MSVTTTKQNKTDVLKSQVRAERTSESVSGTPAVAVSGNMARGAGEVKLASSLATNKGGGGGAVLDRYVSSSNNAYATNSLSSHKPSWTRQQKRGYHRIQSCLQYWQANGFQILWVGLTTAPGGDASKLAYHHQRLRQRIEKKLDYPHIQHYQVRTLEGYGVLHAFWAWRATHGYRQRRFFVPKDWLKRQWDDIHGARITWVDGVRKGRGSRNKVSKYCMAQYVGGQAGYQYMSWSWGRTFGFPLVACWRAFKGIWSKHNGNGRKKGLYAFWGAFLSGEAIPLWSGRYTSLEVVRLGYQEYQSAFWTV